MKKIKIFLIIIFISFGIFGSIKKNQAQAQNPVIVVPGITAS